MNGLIEVHGFRGRCAEPQNCPAKGGSFAPQSCHAFFNISPTFPLSVPFDDVKMKKKTLPVEGSPKSNPMIAPRFWVKRVDFRKTWFRLLGEAVCYLVRRRMTSINSEMACSCWLFWIAWLTQWRV